MTGEAVVLLDALDEEIGVCGKVEAHREGLRHRAFSIFVFDSGGQLLLQQRSPLKYHSGGLWTNTCCGHPRPGESTHTAARRRLKEEMGIECELREVFRFSYRAVLPNGLTENELDHVFVGTCDACPDPDPEEVSDWKRADCATVAQDLQRNPQDYTVWLRICFDRVRLAISV
jgi:isopentenyl-diphosphate delta-isomerase